jgi:hypothetical protein
LYGAFVFEHLRFEIERIRMRSHIRRPSVFFWCFGTARSFLAALIVDNSNCTRGFHGPVRAAPNQPVRKLGGLADRPRYLSPYDSFASLKRLKRCGALSEAVTASRGQFMHPRFGAHGLGEFGQVLMVGEVDDLADASHVGEQAQRLLGANSADSNDVHGIPETDTRLFDDVQMVREQDRLNAIADRRKRFETGARAGIIKAGEKVVADERRRLGAGGIDLNIGKPQR